MCFKRISDSGLLAVNAKSCAQNNKYKVNVDTYDNEQKNKLFADFPHMVKIILRLKIIISKEMCMLIIFMLNLSSY